MKPRKGVGPPALEIAYRITRKPRFSYQTYKTLVRFWGAEQRQREGEGPRFFPLPALPSSAPRLNPPPPNPDHNSTGARAHVLLVLHVPRDAQAPEHRQEVRPSFLVRRLSERFPPLARPPARRRSVRSSRDAGRGARPPDIGGPLSLPLTPSSSSLPLVPSSPGAGRLKPPQPPLQNKPTNHQKKKPKQKT